MALQIGSSTNSIKTASGVTATETLAADFDSFLVLLTTQLKNQDPTSPMETNEFTQQIIGFSQVQQAINTNSYLERMIDMDKKSAVANAVSYVDQFVVAETNDFNLKKGAAFLSYDLPSQAKEVTVTIKDSSGKIINSYSMPAEGNTKGYHKMTWDGKDKNGETMADGQYTMSVVARDEKNEVIEGTKTFATELVTQVDLDGEDIVMYFNNVKFDMDKIRSVIGYYAPTDVPSGGDDTETETETGTDNNTDTGTGNNTDTSNNTGTENNTDTSDDNAGNDTETNNEADQNAA